MELSHRQAIGTKIANGVFLLLLNLLLMFIIGYLTLDTVANLNSRIGAFLLSFFIPIFIVYKTKNLSGLVRMIKYGFGFMAYILLTLIIADVPYSFTSGLVPCLILALATLYYGEVVMNKTD